MVQYPDLRSCFRFCVALAVGSLLFSQQATTPASVPVHLQVDAGTPLRLYMTKRTFFRKGAPVSAKLIELVWAFDRIVVPAGATLKGEIKDLKPVPRLVRARAIVTGDFTPLKLAQVSFTEITLPNGQVQRLSTELSVGLETIYVEPRPAKHPKPPKPQAPGNPSMATKIRQQVQGRALAPVTSVIDVVRGPNKMEWFEEFLLQKLPYHPQWYRIRTRIDAVLAQPMSFGETALSADNALELGEIPTTDSVAQVRLLSTIDSGTSHVGDPLNGVLAQPLFSPDRKLLLPVGTNFTGKVTMVQPARFWHRGGKIRFMFDHVTVPVIAGVQSAHDATPVQTQLSAIEANPGAIQVDEEGTAKATDSKARLLRPLVAALVAAHSADDDAGRNRGINSSSSAGNPNLNGRALGGFSGFGLFGTGASFGPRWIGAALGYYGLGFSVYSNVIGKGLELGFEKNTATEIRFGAAARGTK